MKTWMSANHFKITNRSPHNIRTTDHELKNGQDKEGGQVVGPLIA